MAGLAAALKARARQAGADAAGVAAAGPVLEARRLREWLERGRHGSMSFLERGAETRADIRLWYPPAKSVLMCAFRYAGSGAEAPGPAHGLIARYAALEDYHEALRARMQSVLDWLRLRAPGARGRAFVDTSPVLERAYARRAGLGWIGKNCLLVSPALGSYFLLAGLALDLELEPDEPAAEHCGGCRRCLEACPAGALTAPRELDARLCTAYLTVEHRGGVPEPRRRALGLWLAGCDLCQEACPWNREPKPGALKPAAQRLQPLAALAAMTAADLRRRFGATPLARLRRARLLRNVLLAMGNSGLARWRPELETYSRDPDPVLAESARWSLARLPETGQS
ncbi:MAG: tRNA epoxyqueuosine(34) reductase QueG [Elusimicrobia bacterium]|nr:tRNA epoxyqueuosine(34) reductase QueG [Elusimicrobiota bacterium]